MDHRAITATTLPLGLLLLVAVAVYSVITPTVTPELIAMATIAVALLQIGLLTRGHVAGVHETVDRLASALQESRR